MAGGLSQKLLGSGIRDLAMCKIKFLGNLKSVTLALVSRDSSLSLPFDSMVKVLLCLDNHEGEMKPAKNSILGHHKNLREPK